MRAVGFSRRENFGVRGLGCRVQGNPEPSYTLNPIHPCRRAHFGSRIEIMRSRVSFVTVRSSVWGQGSGIRVEGTLGRPHGNYSLLLARYVTQLKGRCQRCSFPRPQALVSTCFPQQEASFSTSKSHAFPRGKRPLFPRPKAWFSTAKGLRFHFPKHGFPQQKASVSWSQSMVFHNNSPFSTSKSHAFPQQNASVSTSWFPHVFHKKPSFPCPRANLFHNKKPPLWKMAWKRFVERMRKARGKVAEKFRTSCGKVAERLRKSCGKVAEKLQKSCGKVAEKLRKGCGKVAEKLRKVAQTMRKGPK